MCNLTNDVPQLFDWDQNNNCPADRWQRAELNHGVVDFVAPTEYMVRPPQPPLYVFVFDVSYQSVNSGVLATAARALLESLDRLPNKDGRTKVAIIGMDAVLHFFKLTEGNPEPTVHIVGDVDDVFLPSPTDLLVSLTEAREGLENLLSRLHEMYKDNHSSGCALGPALQAAYQMIVSFHTEARCLIVLCISDLRCFVVQRWRQSVCAHLQPPQRWSWRPQKP